MPTSSAKMVFTVLLCCVALFPVVTGTVCDLSQCHCLLYPRGTDVTCGCKANETLALSPSELPGNVYNLTVVGCASLSVSGSLSGLPLLSLTIRDVRDLRIPTHAFLGGLERISTVTIANSTISVVPSFSFSALDNVFSILFTHVEIGTISSDAFSDLMQLKFLRFVECNVGEVERNAFGRGTSKVDNLVFDSCKIGTIHERGVWLDDAEIVHFDKCNINKIFFDAIKLNNAFFFYLTRSAVAEYEAGGIVGRVFSGVMIDNNFLNPVSGRSEEPRPLFELEHSRLRGSSVPPFFHLTNNVVTKIVPEHAFFLTDPTTNVAVPNNTLGDCSCNDYRTFLLSLRPLLDDYTLTIHQAFVEHGLCLVGEKIFSIGCPNLAPPPSPISRPGAKNILIPSRELALRISTETAAKTSRITTEKPKRTKVTTPRPRIRPSIRTTRPSSRRTTTVPTTTARTTTTTTTPRPPLRVQDTSARVKSNSSRLTLEPNINTTPTGVSAREKQTPLDALDLQTIWNEIYGGVFALRLRKPLPEIFPSGEPSVRFTKVIKPLQIRRFRSGKLVVVSPR